MEDEVADDDGEFGIAGKGHQIVPMPLAGGGPKRGRRTTVEAVDGQREALERTGELAGAGAEFEDGLGGADQRRKGASEPAEIAHRGVNEAQIAAAVPGGGVVGRERVEEFGLKLTDHRESNVARRAQAVQCASQ